MFCPNCGTQISDDSAFCENCGTKIEAAVQQGPQQSPYQQAQAAQQQWQQTYAPQDGGTHRMSVRTASLLCYWFSFIGWCISYFLADNTDPYLRFHLNQSLILWLAASLLGILARFRGISFIASLLILLTFVLWVIAFIGAVRGQTKSAPLLGIIPPIIK